jgi:hypothetical protein
MNMGRGRFSEHDNEYDSEDFADFGEISTPMKWLIALGAIGVSAWYFMSRASAQETDQAPNLELSLTFLGTKAPGSDRLRAIGRLLKGIMGNEKFTRSNGSVIDGCPMAPKNVMIVKREAPVSFKLEDGRDTRVVLWRVHADFGADFDSENPYLRDEASACIFKILSTIASNKSVPIFGFRGKRVAQ